MMYLVEGRANHETRGQYVLSKEAAYAIAEEMMWDFPKVNIYEKENGDYKRIEKWEGEITNEKWFEQLSTKEKSDVIANLFVHKETDSYNHIFYDFNAWLKEKHNDG